MELLTKLAAIQGQTLIYTEDYSICVVVDDKDVAKTIKKLKSQTK